MAEAEQQTRRKFVWAPDMDRLREKIEEAQEDAQRAIDAAEAMVDEFEDANDLKQRLAHVVLAVKDFQRGIKDERALDEEINKAAGGVEWPDWLVSELGVKPLT